MNITFDYYNVDSLYYVYPDRLGSYTHITNSSKQVVRALHFDPWGNVKSDGYFHSDYLFGSAAPHYINYNNCVNLENTLAYAFHEPDRMTDADGTSYRIEYYWAAVGAGGEYHLSFANQNFSGVFGRYKETVRWYKREVPVETKVEKHTNDNSSITNVDIGRDTYKKSPPSFENVYDLATANIVFWGGPEGAIVGFMLDFLKRGAKWTANYLYELEMELRRMNTPQTYY